MPFSFGTNGSKKTTTRRMQPPMSQKTHILCTTLVALTFLIPYTFVSVVLTPRALAACRESNKKVYEASAQEHLLRGFQQQKRTAVEKQTSEVDILPAKRKLPTFYLHVGLPKTGMNKREEISVYTVCDLSRILLYYFSSINTGTTFLQCSLCQNANTSAPILLKDNLVYLGTCPKECGGPNQDALFLHHWPTAFFPNGNTKEQTASAIGPIPHNDTKRVHVNDNEPLPQLGEIFVSRVSAARKAGTSALVIFEGCHGFSHKHIEALAKFLHGQQWTVQIIVAYRPLYQWLPSKYNSINKPGRNPAAQTWPGMAVQGNPSIVGQPLLPFDLDNRGVFSELVDDIRYYHQHPAEMVQDNYLRHFDNVQVLPLQMLDGIRHDKSVDPMLEFLFCRAMLLHPTPQTCHAIRDNVIGARMPMNPSVVLDYDMLAVAAYQQGLIQVSDTKSQMIKRGQVGDAIQRRQEHGLGLTPRNFPQKCLPEGKLDRLKKLSLELERRFFRDTWSKRQEVFHHNGFDMNRAKFCWVDTEKLLREDAAWRAFFLSLRGPQGYAKPSVDDDDEIDTSQKDNGVTEGQRESEEENTESEEEDADEEQGGNNDAVAIE